ncbi:MFS transporter [Burkholderia vietnamiensis]|uniref:MFS transporter n=1 Tax=Burkholderia vietnamiensis TaxID=60552 RepID=UPI000752DEFF|nr:MFS transporter [Burkholderia vietnamiensis]KVF25370.1 MFS transporter [Burkholderia vietnamiensis]HDR9199767.1 MFS transporter [Burkholderia vietnamiensis]
MTGRAEQSTRLSGRAVAVLSIAAGGAIANDYAMQPALSFIAADFGVPVAPITAVASGAMIGYLLGLVLLVPLVDKLSPRTLIPGQIAALACALALAAYAPGPDALIACFVVIGATTTVAAQSSAVVGKCADPHSRARLMGTISAGISAGILLSRFVGGVLAQWYGWRGALLTFAAVAAVSAVCVMPLLPAQRPPGHTSYFSTLRSMPSLLRASRQLRLRIHAGMLWFFAFNLIWVGLAVRLAAPPYNLDAAAIGLYSLAGLLGLVVTRVAGRLADRFGSRAVIVCGLAVAAASACALTVSLGHPAATAAALAVFDAGCFAAQVANQASVVAIEPARAGALNSAYLTFYYVAGAIGTAIAGLVVTRAGWEPLVLLAAISTAAATMIGALVAPSVPARNRADLQPHNGGTGQIR